MPGPPPPTETEIKLRLPPAARASLERHPALCPPRASDPEERHEITTYFDTPGRALRKGGFTLRVRARDAERIQTLKRESERSVAERGEWEWEVDGETPKTELLAETPAADLLTQSDGGLQPLATTDIHRTIRMVQLDPATTAELALDSGHIAADGASEPVSELEIELKAGHPGPIYSLALELTVCAPLVLEPSSKAERGARLGGAEPRAPLKHPDIVLPPDATAAQAFRELVASVLGHLLANAEAASRGDMEGVHQIRVAVRRMRAVFGLFKRYLEPHAAARFTDALKRLGQVFGEARDWDVFVLETLPAAAAQAREPGWLELVGDLAELRRVAAHKALQAELCGPAFTGLVLALAGWAEDGARDPALLGDATLGQAASRLGPRLLARTARKVAKRGRRLARASPAELHELRKSAKKLRYAAEFLASLYRRKAVNSYLARCKKIQDLLGAVNDARAVPALAQRLTDAGRADLAPAVASLTGWAERQSAEAMRRVPKAWRKLRTADPFWN